MTTQQESRFAVAAGQILSSGTTREGGFLIVERNTIADIVDTKPVGIETLDYSDCAIWPGLIDLHIHGRDGFDVMDADTASLEAIAKSLAHHGVTGFLATTVTAGWERTLRALEAVGSYASRSVNGGAKLIGAYSEGLFFSRDHRGAHDAAFFLEPTIDRLDAMIAASQGMLRVVALAPEIPGAVEAIGYLNSMGIKVMLGHTDATYAQTTAALERGASGGVHVFNGMRGIHHREPGCAGAVLLHDCLVEVIADGQHLHPAILSLISKLKNDEQIALISDCINAGGLSDGTYQVGELDVQVVDGIARTASGSLAGSTVTLERAVRNMSVDGAVELERAVTMASLAPAKFLGIEARQGSLQPGHCADFAAIDRTGTVRNTWIDGRAIYKNMQSGSENHV